ncbi:MAG: carbohydrate kinase family protein [Acidobacteriota bacterium]|nr:carbohydrate kinase family protein [Acidobacteriota bacterium]
MSKFDVAVVGELNLDIILSGLPLVLQLDREHLAEDLKVTLGSSSAIFAHNLTCLGNKVIFSSTIGNDSLGELCLQRLLESGVDVSTVRRFVGRQTGLSVLLPRGSQRYILTYPGTMSEMRFEDLGLDVICSARHFHLSSYFLQRALRPRMVELFRYVKQAGLTTSLDTNDDPEEQWGADLLSVFKYVDVLLPNEHEACKISKTQDVHSAAKVLSKLVPLVVIKRGSDGAIAQHGSEIFSASAQAGSFVDAVGAGDSFDAGFIHEFIRGGKIEDCLRFGNIAGALSVTRAGGTEAFREKAHRQDFFKKYNVEA